MNLNWYFLSFTEPGRVLGGVYVEGTDDIDAFLRCNELDLNPGGWVEIAGPIPHEVMKVRVPREYRRRLLSAGREVPE